MDFTLLIESVAFGGAGIGRLPDGRVCFVAGTLSGERAVVRLTKEKKNYTEGEVVRLVERSMHRTLPRCPVYGTCGGCSYQHADYEYQLDLKTAQVADVFRRIGGFADARVERTIASPRQWEYRNRISVHIEDGRVGFHHRKTRKLIPVAHCPIACAEVNEQLATLAAAPRRRGNARLTLRAPSPHRGFSQVNEAAAEKLLDVIREMTAGASGQLVDAYCGAGFFAKALAGQFEKVTGIEWSEGAIRAAIESAGPNETYLQGAVENHLAETLRTGDPSQTTLLLDPPAEGLAPDVTAAVLENAPHRLIYISCDPATLARDLKKLSTTYVIECIQPVDMFPQTAEIEVAVSCRKR